MKYGTPKLLASLFLATLVACTGRSWLDAEEARDLLPFVRNDKTTKAEIRTRLGVPYREYEKGRIFTYWLQYKDGGFSKIDWSTGYDGRNPHILVLVFGPDDVLEKHSVVVRH